MITDDVCISIYLSIYLSIYIYRYIYIDIDIDIYIDIDIDIDIYTLVLGVVEEANVLEMELLGGGRREVEYVRLEEEAEAEAEEDGWMEQKQGIY